MENNLDQKKPTSIRSRIIETVGWIGVLLILSAYGLSTLGKLDMNSSTYLWMNLLGATGVVIDAVHDRNWQPVTLNIIWAVIALFGLWQLVRP